MAPEKPSFYNVMILIGHHLPEGRRCFDYSRERINNFFYQQRENHRSVLGGLAFDWNGRFPTCDEIDQALVIMLHTELLTFLHDRPNEYYFTEAVERAYQDHPPRIACQDQAEIEDIAREFNRQLAKRQRITFR